MSGKAVKIENDDLYNILSDLDKASLLNIICNVMTKHNLYHQVPDTVSSKNMKLANKHQCELNILEYFIKKFNISLPVLSKMINECVKSVEHLKSTDDFIRNMNDNDK